MSTAVQDKPETAKKGRPKKSEELPPLDVSALTVEAAPAPTRKSRAASQNPFVGHVRDSYEYEEGRAVVVDAIQRGRVESLIRRAADALGIGVSIQVDEVDGDRVKVSFAGKERRKRKGKNEPAETVSEETAEAEAEAESEAAGE